MRCGCCQQVYEDRNDLAVSGLLTMHTNGKAWRICGPCIQAMWQARHPDNQQE